MCAVNYARHANPLIKRKKQKESVMGKAIILWLIGVPITVIILLKIFGVI